MDIHRSSIKDFIMPKVRSVIVIDYYEGIQGLLRSREEFPYNDFLANPRLRTQTEITWATDSFTERPKLLIDLDGVLKDRYAYALKERINSIEALIDLLKEEEGGVPLSELLSKAVSYIDERSVYCGDGNVVVVNWGLIPRRPDFGSGSIYRSGKFVGNWDKLQRNPDMEKPKVEVEPQSQSYGIDEPIVPIEPVAPIEQNIPKPLVTSQPQNTEPESPIADVSPNQISNEHEEHPESLKDVQPSQSEMTQPQSEIVAEEKPVIKEVKKEATEKPQEETKENMDKNSKKDDDEYTWKTFFGGFWKGLKFIIRKLWWILLFFILLFAILFLCRGCQGPISQINPFYNPLPDNPIILPIENGEVGMSADGKTQIATDRLNILLEKENDNTMLDWAKAFKKAYPDEDYEIFYYNKELYNLQIKVPSNMREQVKKEIKEKLSNFSFDVFDETVYQSEDVSFNDPELKDPMHSWYLKEIGAYDAWQILQGDSDVVVAIVDNGFDLTHPEFKGKIIHPYNVLTQNSSVRPIKTKKGENAHGTHVAATAVGNGNNGTGLLGIAPKCKLLPVQVGNDNPDGSMSNQAIMEGVMYAISQGADVINVSLGMYTPGIVKTMSEAQQLNYISSSMKQEELMWSKIFEKAKQKNSIIVFAAGNDNVVSGIDPKKRSIETIRVSALNTDLSKAHFSNFGVYPQLNRFYSTVSAPGIDIYSAAPHNSYTSMNGTSMAAPVVSGVVALLKSIDKSLTVSQITSILQQSGRNVGDNIGPMINLHRAVLLAKGEKLPTKCDEISEEVKRLKAKIDSLTQICPDAGAPSDTLKYNEAVKDKHGLDGLWKSTTSLVSTKDNTPIELYMEFKKLKGTLTIVKNKERYKAPLKASIKKGKIRITQNSPATNGKDSFVPYKYNCTADRKGNLICTATSTENSVTFNLIRIK